MRRRHTVPGVDDAGPGPAPILRSRSVLGVAVLRVRDTSNGYAEDASHALQHAIARTPRAVVCDLTGVVGPLAPETIWLLRSSLEPLRDWPGTPLVFTCRPGPSRDALTAAVGSHATVTDDLSHALRTVIRSPSPDAVVAHLPPAPDSPRVARDLVARTCTRWGHLDQIGATTLVASELVTNAVLHAGTELDLRFAACGPVLRLSVHDRGPGDPRLQPHDPASPRGRGLQLVDSLTRSWGVLPTRDPGKTVWAILGASP